MHMYLVYYKMPHSDLDKGLVKLDCDRECNRMYELSRLFGKLEVYVNLGIKPFAPNAQTCADLGIKPFAPQIPKDC